MRLSDPTLHCRPTTNPHPIRSERALAIVGIVVLPARTQLELVRVEVQISIEYGGRVCVLDHTVTDLQHTINVSSDTISTRKEITQNQLTSV